MFDRPNWLLQVQCSICVRDHPASSSQQDPKSGHNIPKSSQSSSNHPKIRPHHPSRTQNPDTMPGLRANSTSQHPPSGRRVQNVPELDADRGCLNRVNTLVQWIIVNSNCLSKIIRSKIAQKIAHADTLIPVNKISPERLFV